MISLKNYLVRSGFGFGELDVDASAVVHDGLDDLASGSDNGVVDLGWDLDLNADHIGLFSLDLLDFIPGFLHIGLLASDGDHVRVRATLWQVNLGAEKMAHIANTRDTIREYFSQ